MNNNRLNNWFKEVNAVYDLVLSDMDQFDSGPIMIDIDETIIYKTNFPIPNAITWLEKLSQKFTIYLVTGRVDTTARFNDTIIDLIPFKYDKLIMRPTGENHKDFKLRIKNQIDPVFSVGDQLYDYPEYLIPNPFYFIDANGDEINII